MEHLEDFKLVLVQTGDKYDDWYKYNMLYMVSSFGCKHSTLVFREEKFDGVWNKLQIFEELTDPEARYLYLDLDTVLTKNPKSLVRDKFTLLHSWWRPQFHTPLNSSIMSWSGDMSHIYKKFMEDPELYQLKYQGIDEFLYKEFEDQYNIYDEPVCGSYRWQGFDDRWVACLFNQRYEKMKEQGEWSKYTLTTEDTNKGPESFFDSIL